MRLALIAGLLLAACGEAEEPVPPPATNIADNGVPVKATPSPTIPKRPPDAKGPGTALGLTYLQLEDAELVDSAGTSLGEVERIEADAAGTIRALLVELMDARLVRVPLTGLMIVSDGDDWNLRYPRAAAELAALPTVPR